MTSHRIDTIYTFDPTTNIHQLHYTIPTMFNAARTIWQNFADSGWPLPAGGADGNGDRDHPESDEDEDEDDDDNSDAMSYGGFYEPSYADVLVAKALLQRCGRLPLELVDDIVDMAEYWPKTHVEVDFYENRRNGIFVPVRQSRNTGKNQFILRTPPLGFRAAPTKEDNYSTKEPEPRPSRNDGNEATENAGPGTGGADDAGVLCSDDDVRTWFPVGQAPPLEHPCRKIVFTLISHDQGWANNQRDRGSFKGSYSWFDVGLERYGVPESEKDDKEKEEEETEPKEQKPEFQAVPPAASLYTLRPDVVAATEQPSTFHGEPTSASMTQEPKRYQFSFPLLPGVDRLQSNRVATSAWTEYNIVWSWTDSKEDWDVEEAAAEAEDTIDATNSIDGAGDGDEAEAEAVVHPLEKIGRGSETGNGEFVRNLRVGDVVTLWAKARFPGWVNMVQRAEIDVYWAV